MGRAGARVGHSLAPGGVRLVAPCLLATDAGGKTGSDTHTPGEGAPLYTSPWAGGEARTQPLGTLTPALPPTTRAHTHSHTPAHPDQTRSRMIHGEKAKALCTIPGWRHPTRSRGEALLTCHDHLGEELGM